MTRAPVLSPPAPGGEGGEGGGGRWEPTSGQFLCGHSDRDGPRGWLDETARRLSHEEHYVADTLATEGHGVRSLAESRRGGRRADLEVCGRSVEVKSWLPLPERGGRAPTPQSVFNKLVDAAGQAEVVVLYARGSGLTPGTARRGMALYASTAPPGRLSAVRVIGDGFDLGWVFRRGLSKDRGLLGEGPGAMSGGPGSDRSGRRRSGDVERPPRRQGPATAGRHGELPRPDDLPHAPPGRSGRSGRSGPLAPGRRKEADVRRRRGLEPPQLGR